MGGGSENCCAIFRGTVYTDMVVRLRMRVRAQHILAQRKHLSFKGEGVQENVFSRDFNLRRVSC